MTIPVANIYYLLCYAWRHIEELDVVRLEEIEGLHETHHLLGKVLAQGTARLIRAGIDQGYQDVREDLAGVRGKLMIGEMAKRALRTRGRTACEFEELSRDVLHNRILRSTLGALLKLPDMDTEVRSEIRTVYGKLDGIRLVRLNRRLFQQMQLDRNRHVYRFLMSICELIHDYLLVDERTGETRFLDIRKDNICMWSLFEDFVIEFYRREQHHFDVNRDGRRIHWNDEGTREDQRSMIPRMEGDVLLDSQDRRIVLDAKWYTEPLSHYYGGRKLRSDNLYQLLTYLQNREATANPGPHHEGILLYPVVTEPVRADVCLEGFAIRARGIDLAQPWHKIHDDMLALIDE